MREKTKEVIDFFKKNYKLVIIFVFLILFLETLQEVFANELMYRDIIGYKFISKYLICDAITPIAKFITWFGGVIGLIIVGIITTIIIRDKKIGICIWINLATIGALNQILKRVVQRPRPTEYRIIEESGYSFPSGHSMASAAFYGFFIYLIFTKVKSKKVKTISITLLGLLIALIGISRIYLGVHYTSDVIAGFSISISYLIIFTSIAGDYIDKPNGESKENKEEI